jgi:hypothetical protein
VVFVVFSIVFFSSGKKDPARTTKKDSQNHRLFGSRGYGIGHDTGRDTGVPAYPHPPGSAVFLLIVIFAPGTASAGTAFYSLKP